MPVVSSQRDLFEKPRLYTQHGMVSVHREQRFYVYFRSLCKSATEYRVHIGILKDVKVVNNTLKSN
jgi:hypothetical protein